MEETEEEYIPKEKSNLRWGTIIPLIGGMALGCELATGVKPLYYLTYKEFSKNEIHLRRYRPDIPYIDLSRHPDIPAEYCRDIDFISTVCPCAGLSMLNNSTGNKSRGGDAVQNEWMFKSAEFVLKKIRPKCLWGENAPALFTKVGESVLESFKKIGLKYGYTLSVMKTNTLLHGIPQNRIRTFYFFWRSPTVPFLQWKERPRVNIVEYLNQVPGNSSLQTLFMTDGQATQRFAPYQFVLEKTGMSHKEFAIHYKGTVISYLMKNKQLHECIEWLKTNGIRGGFYNSRKSCRTFIQYLEHCKKKVDMGLGFWDESPRFVGLDYWPALIRKSMISAVHPLHDRFLNVREMMHLMGLPHDFEIDHRSSINHIAQNVPVTTAEDWAHEVVKFCVGEASLTNFKYMKQDNVRKCCASEEMI